MSIESAEDLVGLKRVGRVVALAMREMAAALRPGITTRELDGIGAGVLKRHGARSAPNLSYGFPGATCISLNDEAAHGIPGPRVIRTGDLINIDVSAELGGYFADTGASFPVDPAPAGLGALCAAGRRALEGALRVVRAGEPLNAVGRAVEEEARRGGYAVITNLSGHGVGRRLHEEPADIHCHYEPRDRRRFRDGVVLTIEPFLTTGADHVVEAGDGWTLRTPDGSLVVQYEHTVVVTRQGPIVVTSLEEQAA